MKKLLPLALMVLFSLTGTLSAQKDCRVLLPAIGDSYKGTCKNGLADGKGEASGVDRYTGEFKKGLPDGEGTYTWQSGDIYKGEWKKGLRDGKGELSFRLAGNDSIITGLWREDKYLGKEVGSPYVIGYRNNVGRIVLIKMPGESPYNVKYKFSRAGEASSFIAITNILLQGSSGSEHITTSFTGYQDVKFPFEGKIQFNAPNALNTSSLNCEVRFTINEPSSWLVTIYY